MYLTARILGLVVVAVLVAVGLAVAGALLPLLIGLAALVAFAALCVWQEAPGLATSRFGRNPLSFAVGTGIGFVVVASAVIGMTVLLGGAAVALTAATALAVLVHRRLGAGTDRDTEHGAAHPTGSPRTGVASVGATGGSPPDGDATGAGARRLLPADPAALSTAELCRAWRVSYLLLQNARGPEALEDAAELRRRYLDELAHRHPDGFRRWLDDGARAASDPSRYVQGAPGSGRADEDRAA